jgi:hypothetical protein
VVVPIHSVNNTSLIAISTPDDEFNYFSKLLELKRDDKDTPLFLTLQVRQTCDACHKERKRCRHNEELLPPWRSAQGQKLAETIMRSNPDLYAREMLGVVRSNDTLFVFEPKLVDEFNISAPYRFTLPPSVVWVAIDPSGGGSLSNYAIVSMTFQRGQSIVIGADHTDSFRDEDIMGMVRHHLTKIRQDATFGSALIVVFVEACSDYVHANRLSVEFGRHPFMPILFEAKDPKGKGRVGVRTGPHEKTLYVQHLTSVLVDHTLCWAHQMIPVYKEDGRFGDIRFQLVEQMKKYRRVVGSPDDPVFGKFKESFTGKSGGGDRDDLCMALQICLYFSREKRNQQDFRDFCMSRGILL